MPRCAVERCTARADYEVILYDFFGDQPSGEEVFWEQDFTCPYLCGTHVKENELSAQGIREPLGLVEYRYTNQHRAGGFSIYRPLVPAGSQVSKSSLVITATEASGDIMDEVEDILGGIPPICPFCNDSVDSGHPTCAEIAANWARLLS